MLPPVPRWPFASSARAVVAGIDIRLNVQYRHDDHKREIEGQRVTGGGPGAYCISDAGPLHAAPSHPAPLELVLHARRASIAIRSDGQCSHDGPEGRVLGPVSSRCCRIYDIYDPGLDTAVYALPSHSVGPSLFLQSRQALAATPPLVDRDQPLMSCLMTFMTDPCRIWGSCREAAPRHGVRDGGPASDCGAPTLG
jgi:hypothetical protein